jgi:glycosidase
VRQAEEGEGAPGRVEHGLRRLLEIRRRHPASVDVHPEVISVTPREVVAYAKRREDDVLVLLVNFSERDVDVLSSELPSGDWFDAWAGKPVGATIDLGPYGIAIIEERRQNSEG